MTRTHRTRPATVSAAGVELYYNAAVTPWFHLTGDFQFVEPANTANDTAVVLGLRGKIDL